MIFENDIIFPVIKLVFVTACTVGMVMTLTRFKYSFKRVLCIFGAYLAWVAVSSAVLIYLLGPIGAARVFLFTISAPGIFIAYLMDSNSPAQSVFNYTTQIAFSIMLTMGAAMLTHAISGNQYVDLLIRTVSYAVVIYLEYKFLRQPLHRITNVVKTGWGLLSLIPVFFCMLLVLVGTVPVHYLENPVGIVYILGVVITMFVVYFSVYQSLVTQYRVQMLSHDKEVLQVQISAMNKQSEAVFTAEEKMRILRHDVRHFTKIIQSELQQGASPQALSVLSALEAAVKDTTTKYYCDNYIINSILASYFTQAEKEGIAVKVNFCTPPIEAMDATAFSVMLANALENALDACRLESGSRFIELKSRVCNGHYLMELSNTCSASVEFDKAGLPVSLRGEGHGIGARSILAFAKQQRAKASFQVESGHFLLQMIFDLGA